MLEISSEKGFSKSDIDFLDDKEFFIRKHRLMTDMYELLAETRNVLKDGLTDQWQSVSRSAKPGKGKISKGENYQQLPYLVLDYPAVFDQKEGVFAIRTMFWWGNGFSMTLHVNGKLLQIHKSVLINNLERIKLLDGYFGVNEDQWQHHYEETNYCNTNGVSRAMLENSLDKGFLKLSLRLPVSEYENLATWTLKSAKALLNLFN